MGLDIEGTNPSTEPSTAPLSAQDSRAPLPQRLDPTQAWHGKVLRNRVVPPIVHSAGAASRTRVEAIRPAPGNQQGLRTHSHATSRTALKSVDRERVERKLSDSVMVKPDINSDLPKTSSTHATTSLEAATMEGHGRVAEAPKRAAAVPGSASNVPRAAAQEQPNSGNVQDVTLCAEAAGPLVGDVRNALAVFSGILQRMDQRMAALEDKASSAGHTNDVPRPHVPVNPPSKFNGQKPREWLSQMEQYYTILGFSDSLRVMDVFSFLEGPALSHYCLARKDGRDPKTWEDFTQFITQRFCPRSEGATLRRLRELKWDGSLDSLIERFASVLEEGTPPAEIEIIRLFLGRIPWTMCCHLRTVYYPSWTAVAEAIRVEEDPRDVVKQFWLTEVQPELRELDERLSGGYMLTNHSAVDWQKLHTHPAESSRGRRAELSCYTCGGSGHKAHTCPTAHEQTMKEGAICNKCAGRGHWARDCTTKQTRVQNETNVNKRNSDSGSAHNERRSLPGSGNDQA